MRPPLSHLPELHLPSLGSIQLRHRRPSTSHIVLEPVYDVLDLPAQAQQDAVVVAELSAILSSTMDESSFAVDQTVPVIDLDVPSTAFVTSATIASAFPFTEDEDAVSDSTGMPTAAPGLSSLAPSSAGPILLRHRRHLPRVTRDLMETVLARSALAERPFGTAAGLDAILGNSAASVFTPSVALEVAPTFDPTVPISTMETTVSLSVVSSLSTPMDLATLSGNVVTANRAADGSSALAGATALLPQVRFMFCFIHSKLFNNLSPF